MNTIAHTVSPEDLMSFLDGELPASAAEAVAAHLAECEECDSVATQFRNLSQSISLWTVLDTLPDDRESAIKELGSDAAYSHRYARRYPLIQGGWGSWKPWVVAAGFVAAAVFLVVPFSSFQSRHEYLAPPPASVSRQPQMSIDSRRLLANTNATRSLADSRATITADQLAQMSTDDVAHRNEVAMLAGNESLAAPAESKVASAALPVAQMEPAAPMIARTVNLTLMVKDFGASRVALDQILARHHGYFAQLEVNTQEGAPHNLTASLRIPAPDLASTLVEIRSVGRVLSETQSGEEVTQQHQDLAIRLQNSRETEERFRAILEQRTGKLADVLSVEESIARVRGEIEAMEAEQKNLEHRVDFATVEIRLSEEYKAQINVPDNSVPTRLHNAFVAGYHNASETILGIVMFLEEYGPSILIWLALLALPVLGWMRYRRLRSKL